MSETREELTATAQAVSPQPASSSDSDASFRDDLAFPRLSDEMLQKLGHYGQEEIFPQDSCLYLCGDRDTDMFVVLSGEIESRLLVEGGWYEILSLLACWRIQWRAESAEHAAICCRSSHDIDESTVANLSKELAGVDACRGRDCEHYRFRLHMASHRHDE